MAFRKSAVGWKKRFKHENATNAKKQDKDKDSVLRWTPGSPGEPKRHTFSADFFQKKQRVGFVTRRDPSLIRRLKSDLSDLSLPQHFVVAKSRARQDMAATRMMSVFMRHANKLMLRAMFYWKYGAMASIQRRTEELEEALESSNDLNDHLENQLKEVTLKLDNVSFFHPHAFSFFFDLLYLRVTSNSPTHFLISFYTYFLLNSCPCSSFFFPV